MKQDLWLIVVVIMILVALAGMMAFNTIIGQQQRRIREDEEEKAALEAEIVSLRAELVVERTPEPYSLPLDQLWISSGTGYRVPPMGGIGAEEKLHRGTDLAGDIGNPVYAMLAGMVVEHWVPPDGGQWKGHPIYGGYIVIDNGDELLTEYAHLSVSFVHEGDWVETGEKIGLVGDTGVCTGPHLHAAVVISPLRYFAERSD